MRFMDQNEWPEAIDRLYKQKKSFFFIISFDLKKGFVLEEHLCEKESIHFDFNPKPIIEKKDSGSLVCPPSFQVQQVEEQSYRSAFDQVLEQIHFGNTYLLNLCFQSRIKSYHSLGEIYHQAQAPYKLLFKDEFVVFSPEPFITIQDQYIYTYPMKGTIDATIKGAHELLRHDEKEMAEHYTIVDLLRNDIGQVSEKVEVRRFAYIEEFKTHHGPILQMSSEIRGNLTRSFQDKPGSILKKILPAGSVSGAPKEKTIEIIRSVESFERGFYTGIMGHYNGDLFQTAVMIRFIEKDKNGVHWYKSGGGITHLSEWKREFDELNRKIYLPFF